MRAVYFPQADPKSDSIVEIDGDSFHHLANVVRVKLNDEILLLFGLGKSAKAKIIEINKNKIKISINELKVSPRFKICDILIIAPKKDALESMLKAATELGVSKIFLFRGAYSQEKLPEEKRILAILQSALEQSNNPWMPSVAILDSLVAIKDSKYDVIWYMDVAQVPRVSKDNDSKMAHSLLVIGPEAGYSSTERDFLTNLPESRPLTLETPILRAPTALVAGLGWWLSRT